MLKSIALRCLLRRTPEEFRGSINIDNPANDYVFVTLFPSGGGDDDRMVLRDIVGKQLVCNLPERNGEIEQQSVALSEMRNYSFRIRYFYKGWVVLYDGLVEAFRDICLRGILLKRILQVRYDSRLKLLNNRMVALKAAIDLGRGANLSNERTVQQLCEHIYGDRIMLSQQAYDYLMEMRFIVGSFKESGEVLFDENVNIMHRFTITPKALEAVAKHELEMRKFRDTVAVARGQLLVSIMLMVLTAFLLWTRLR